MSHEPDRCCHCDVGLWDVPSPWPRCETCKMPACSEAHLKAHLDFVATDRDPIEDRP